MRDLGYVPNLIAGGLASTNTRVIAAIVPYLLNGVFADLVQGVSDVLRSEGYSLLLGSSNGDPEEEEVLLTRLLGQRPAGVVLHGGNHTRGTRTMLRNAEVHVVETGNLVKDPIDLVVGYSNFEAARAMTRYLSRRGFRRIAFVTTDPTNNDRAEQRLAGYRAAVRERGLPDDDDLVVQTTFGVPQGADALSLLLGRKPKVDAAFFAGDIWAIGAILECHRQRITVPGRVGIAGFDDQDIATQVVPALTTVQVPRYEIGRWAARLLLDRLEDGTGSKAKVDVGFEIVERDST